MNLLTEINRNLPPVLRAILFLAAIFAISLFFPGNANFKYDFKKGRVWKYEDLYAPVDFPIRKSKIEIDSIQSNLMKDFIPVFNKVSERELEVSTAMEKLIKDSGAKWEGSKEIQEQIPDFSKFLFNRLSQIYNKGIFLFPASSGLPDTIKVIQVQAQGVLSLRSIDQFYTLKSARDELTAEIQKNNPKLAEFWQTELSSFLRPNIEYNAILSQKILDEESSSIVKASGKVSKGEIIIRKGAMVDEEAYQQLMSLKERHESQALDKNSRWQVYVGHLLFSMLVMGLFYLYLVYKAPEVINSFRKLSFFLLLIVLFSYIVFAVEKNTFIGVYIVPICVVPIVIKNFFDEKLAFITLIILILIASFITTLGLDFAFLMILGGLVAVLIETETRYWAGFFYSIFLIIFAFFMGYLCISLIKEGSLDAINWKNYNWLLLNGVLTLLAYPMIPLVERIFGFTSSITLAELSDLNKPLLKKLSIRAPGTFQHSIQVANMAEAAANKIGANALMVKVGALYHDIGKIKNPGFFVENTGERNPHNELGPLESAKIIIDHVNEGVLIAKEYNLPPVIIDFIRTHHGTTKVEYFYRKYLESNAKVESTDALFTYPGPRPRTKEQTLLMIADSLEAASRSMQFNSAKDIEQFVDVIIQQKLIGAQLQHSELSFEELEIAKKVFKKMLKSIYHARIEYPKQQQE
jgi:putative nucleotidyltransferase with HDIG domain